MAITKEVTKISVQESSGNKHITLNVSVKDNGVQFASRNFSIDYNKDTDVENEIKKLKSKMQKFIDLCVEDRAYYNNVKLDAAVSYLNTNLTP